MPRITIFRPVRMVRKLTEKIYLSISLEIKGLDYNVLTERLQRVVRVLSPKKAN